MARDTETFLGRWSRLKREEEKKLPEQAPAGEKAEVAPPTPPLESLTPQSDFTAFMHPKVQDSLRRVALKKLFSDPHFNVEDLNEAYSGDWTGGEPITPEMLKRLNQARTLLFSDDEKKALEAEGKQAEEEQERARLAAAAEEPTQPEQDAKADEPGRQDT